jgi:hypothetical protein
LRKKEKYPKYTLTKILKKIFLKIKNIGLKITEKKAVKNDPKKNKTFKTNNKTSIPDLLIVENTLLI